MALCGKLIGYVEIGKKGDVFHDLLRHTPHEIAKITPHIISSKLSVGKRKFAKDIIEAVNEENKTIVFKVTGGELVDELYKSFSFTFHVEQKGDGQVVTWTIDYEKPDASVRYPTYEMDFVCDLVRELDAHDNTK